MTDESLFAAALAIGSSSERRAYLDRACAGNPALRREIDELLAAHAAGNPLDRPPADLARTGGYESADDPPAAAVGDRVGPYRLMEQIGEGGMGLVFVAEQTEPVRRKVALKVIKPGMDTRQVVARFEAERQALALMDHPHIARVLDAGATPEGRPYFVMELVRGLPITDYCDQQKLPPRERLALFVQVCQAVQHAHQKGVIHRDIKPSNVLVAPHDGVPVVKVIDFGVAKAVGQSLTDKTIYTRVAQMIGTPLYMSPEQAELNQLDVDTRADVYALGVLLYELLTGTTPFDGDRFRKAAFDEIRRILREEDPPKPSTRLTSLGETLTGVSARRGTEPGKLAGLVRGELDWIVMKCLEKDRNRRYDSAAGLAKDVQRHLAGDAVEACPPTWGYRLRKAYRKNAAAVRVGMVFVCMALGAAGMGAFLAVQAKRAERAAEAGREEAEVARNAEADHRAEAERLAADLKRAAYATDINLAAASLELGNVVRARELLDRTRPAAGEPGFEWHYLRRELQQETATFPGGYDARVAISPDGNTLAVTFRAPRGAVETAFVRVLTRNGRELWTAGMKGMSPGAIAYSPDGSHVVVERHTHVTTNGVSKVQSEIGVWEVATGTARGRLSSEEWFWSAAAFSPDGQTVAGLLQAGLGGSAIAIRTYATAGLAQRSETPIPGARGAYGDLAYTPAGRLRVAYRDGDTTVRVRDDLNGPDVLTFDAQADGSNPLELSLTPDGSKLAVATEDRQVRVWNLGGDAPVLSGRFRVEHYSRTARVRLSPDGRSVGVAGSRTSGRQFPTVWDGRSGRMLQALRGHSSVVMDIEFGPDGRLVTTASDDGTAKQWDVPPGTEPDPNSHASTSVAAGLAVRPSGGFVSLGYSLGMDPATKSVTGVLVVRTQPDGEAITRVPRGPGEGVVRTTGAIAPDGSRLAVTDRVTDRVKVWDAATGKMLVMLPPAGVSGVAAWFGSADRLIVLEPDYAYRLYDLSAGRPVARFPGGKTRLDQAALSPDGRLLATHTNDLPDTPVVIRDVATGSVLHSLPMPVGGIVAMVFNRDGSRLVTTGPRGTMLLWDTATGRVLHRLTGHAGWVQAAAFTPDGRRLFTSGRDSMVKVWDTESGQDLLTLRHDDPVEAIAVSADGHRLATQVSRGAVVRVFDATPLQEPPK
ncbi:MAG: protein kinase [Gemmataceae bacterium]